MSEVQGLGFQRNSEVKVWEVFMRASRLNSRSSEAEMKGS